MDPALIAAGGIAAFAAGWLGAVSHHTLFASNREESPNVSKPGDDAFTIARLTDEVNHWVGRASVLVADNSDLRAENRKLRSLLCFPDAGLQSSGGIDPTVSA